MLILLCGLSWEFFNGLSHISGSVSTEKCNTGMSFELSTILLLHLCSWPYQTKEIFSVYKHIENFVKKL